MTRPLTPKQEKFAVEYVRLGDGNAAYRNSYNASGSSVDTVSRRATELLSHSVVAARIVELRDKAAERNNFGVLQVLDQWVAIATADPSDLVEYRRFCCRHCYGEGHRYQWTELEFVLASEKAANAKGIMPDAMGGFGYIKQRLPHPSCPVCHGEGEPDIYIAETKKLKGTAKALFAGIKQTRDGIQVLMRDQDDALRNIAKFLGMFKERVELTGKDGKLLVAALAQLPVDPIEAAKVYQKFMSDN